MRPSSFLRGFQKNKALSNVLFTASFFLISSHALRYHDLDASLRPYTVFLSSHRFEVFASGGGITWTTRSIGNPCKNADLTSML